MNLLYQLNLLDLLDLLVRMSQLSLLVQEDLMLH